MRLGDRTISSGRPAGGRGILAVLALIGALASVSVRAATPEVEVAGGSQRLVTQDRTTEDPSGSGAPGERLDGTAMVLAVRGGVTLRKLGLRGNYERAKTWEKIGGVTRSLVEIEASWPLLQRGRIQLRSAGSFGLAATRATDAQESESKTRRVASLGAGFDLRFSVAKRFYVEPRLRVRCYAGGSDDPDVAALVGFGFVLGPRDRSVNEPAR